MYGGGHPVWRRPCETVVNIRYQMEGMVGFIAMWIKYALLASFTVKRN